jgi:hypothetical protein
MQHLVRSGTPVLYIYDARLLRVNIQKLYVLSTLYLCVLYLYQNKQQILPLTA